MNLPPFNADGDLPPGIHFATLGQVLERFGNGPLKRRSVANRLEHVYRLAMSTKQVARFVVFGSFVTDKSEPNDVDIVILMQNTFDSNAVEGEAAMLFQHMDAETRFGASIFWCRRANAIGGEQKMIEFWQTRRDGSRRGIVDISLE